jgi:hypothetical protein
MKQSHFAAVFPIAIAASLLLIACDKSSPSASTSQPGGAKAGASAAAGDAKVAAGQAAGEVTVNESLESLGVTLPSFDELRAKASQTITPDNADAEFERLQLEAEAEGG